MLFFARFDLPPLNFGGVFFRSVCAHLTAEVERNEQKKKKRRAVACICDEAVFIEIDRKSISSN